MTRLAALVLTVGLVTGVAAAQKDTEKVDRTIAFRSGGTLKLKNFSGEVRITGGNREEVVIAAVRRATRENLDRIKLDIHVDGSTLVIDANNPPDRSYDRERHKDNVVETTFEISVPRRISLDVDVFSSNVRVDNVEGRQKVHGFSGTIVMHEVAGPIDAHTFSGDVEVGLTGTIDQPELDVETFSGDIRAQLSERASGRVAFTTFSGDLQSDLPLTLRSGGRKNISADLSGGGTGNQLRFKTFSGDVRLTK